MAAAALNVDDFHDALLVEEVVAAADTLVESEMNQQRPLLANFPQCALEDDHHFVLPRVWPALMSNSNLNAKPTSFSTQPTTASYTSYELLTPERTFGDTSNHTQPVR